MVGIQTGELFVKSTLEAGNVFAVIEVPHLLRAGLVKYVVRILSRVFKNAAHDGFVDNSGVNAPAARADGVCL